MKTNMYPMHLDVCIAKEPGNDTPLLVIHDLEQDDLVRQFTVLAQDITCEHLMMLGIEL